jgi:hypothetical protein
MRFKLVKAELTISTYIMVKIDQSDGDDLTPASTNVELSDWDRKDIEEQLEQHVQDNQQEIMEE